MKKTILAIAALGLFTGATTLISAEDIGNMPGMNQTTPTNATATGTNTLVKPYPLNYCLVSGDKLGGDMGKPITTNYLGQQFKFCCTDCVKDFKKNPDKYVKKLAKEESKAKLSAPDKN